MNADKRLQVARQHRAVAHLAWQIAMLSADCAELIMSGHHDGIIDIQGNDTHQWMNTLGDMLNSVDAANPVTIQWMTPIYKRAREMFPLEKAAEVAANKRRGSPSSGA